MDAFYLEAADAPPLTQDQLLHEGIVTHELSPFEQDWAITLPRIARELLCTHQDEVVIGPDTADQNQLRDEFWQEHKHESEEVRFICQGRAFFDIRDTADRWIRLQMRPGDLLVLPAGRYHRFAWDTGRKFVALRLYHEEHQWTSIPRQD